MSIKYYHLATDEELPEEFCVIKDIGGEPSEYTFYERESMNASLQNDAELLRKMLQAKRQETNTLMFQNTKLRELVDMLRYCAHEAHGICARWPVGGGRPFTCCPFYDFDTKEYKCKKLMREVGIEV